MNESAAAGEEALARGAGGAMLYDASCLGQSDFGLLSLDHWQQAGRVETTPCRARAGCCAITGVAA
jgi:hypothetical protein